RHSALRAALDRVGPIAGAGPVFRGACRDTDPVSRVINSTEKCPLVGQTARSAADVHVGLPFVFKCRTWTSEPQWFLLCISDSPHWVNCQRICLPPPPGRDCSADRKRCG